MSRVTDLSLCFHRTKGSRLHIFQRVEQYTARQKGPYPVWCGYNEYYKHPRSRFPYLLDTQSTSRYALGSIQSHHSRISTPFLQGARDARQKPDTYSQNACRSTGLDQNMLPSTRYTKRSPIHLNGVYYSIYTGHMMYHGIEQLHFQVSIGFIFNNNRYV